MILLVLTGLLHWQAAGISDQSGAIRIQKAEIADPVESISSSGLSYAIYLPSSYDPEKKSAVLYCLDARKRGKVPVELFRPAADKYGWILVGSNDAASDDPTIPFDRILNALWKDTHSWFSIDERRVYVTGFSGTARVACEMGRQFNGQIAGVIGCGAGFPNDLPAKIAFSYYGIVGDNDFNYLEVKRLRMSLPKVEIPGHHIRIIHGSHDWPPPEVCTEAVEWMELIAMKDRVLTQRPEAIEEFYTKRTHLADTAQAEGNLSDAAYEYESVVRDFSNLRNVSTIESRHTELQNSKQFKKFFDAEKDRDQQELNYARNIGSFMRSLNAEDASLPHLGEVLADLQVKRWKDVIHGKGSAEEKLSAERMTRHVFVQAAFYLPRELLKEKRYRAAVLSLQVALEIDAENPGVWYSLARTYALWGQQKKAMENLHTAVQKGFHDADRLRNDDSFQVLAGDKEFQQLLRDLQQS